MEYVHLDGVEGKYFTCDAYKSLLSVTACARNYTASRDGSGSRVVCRGCETGAAHAGERPIVEVAKTLCARCGGTEHRLIRGSVCICCYNREMEFLAGKNAKGTFPTHARRVRPMDVAIVGGGEVHLSRVASPIEAAVTAFRAQAGSAIRLLPQATIEVGSKGHHHFVHVPCVLIRRQPQQMRLF